MPVHVRAAPVAVAGDPVTAAPGEPVGFDGAGSTPSDSPITGFHWTFGDGTEAEGATASHAYANPGLYRVVLRVEDDSGHPCDFGVATRLVTVNFPPVAEAGEARSAAVGEPVTLGGGASYDVDGAVTAHRWDMGDGTRLDGATVTHAYAAPGHLHRDADRHRQLGRRQRQRDATPSRSPSTRRRCRWRPAPIARSRSARSPALDAGGSTDADGAILSWSWDFGDGATGEGPVGAVRLGCARGLPGRP